MVESVTSAQNPKIKKLLALQEKSRLRREEGLFVVEGKRELGHCLSAGFEADTIFWCPSVFGKNLIPEDEALLECGAHLVELPQELYDKVAYRGGTEGIIAEVKERDRSLGSLPSFSTMDHKPLIVVLESVEKPGNLGAVLRSADAAGADAVIICDPLTDLYNPNLIRASIGAVFTLNVAVSTSQEAITWLRRHHIQILTAQLQDSSLYYDTDMMRATAIVIGTEATGLSDEWRQAATSHIRIPMLGRLDSLNASVSAAILLFEAVRQRQSL